MRRSVGGPGGGGEIHLADHITAWELFGQTGDGFASGQKPFGPGSWQLYDLSVDAGVTDDISAAHGDKMEELMAA
ncbi:hypothetical protein NHJ13734_008255 [Beauveria thailandica]